MAPLRLAEAIRLGSMLHPQTYGHSFMYEGPLQLTIVASCAMGAARAAGYYYEPEYTGELPCPVCAQVFGVRAHDEDTVVKVVVHLNDDHKWTREAIADWIDTVLPSTSPATDLAEEVCT